MKKKLKSIIIKMENREVMEDYNNQLNPIKDQIVVFYLGNEKERLLAPVRIANARRVYILLFKNQQTDTYFQSNYKAYIEPGLKEINPNMEINLRDVDLLNYFAIMKELSTIIKEEREKNINVEIYLNLSTGTTIASIATVDAARLWHVKPIYVWSDNFNPKGEIKHTGEMKMMIPPIFPIEKPKWEFIETLKILRKMIDEIIANGGYSDSVDKNYVMKANLQKALIKNNILPTKTKSQKETAKQMSLKQKILNPLEEMGYITSKKESRSKKIFLTPEGLNIAKIFEVYHPRDIVS